MQKFNESVNTNLTKDKAEFSLELTQAFNKNLTKTDAKIDAKMYGN
jgi:hypothetical protein